MQVREQDVGGTQRTRSQVEPHASALPTGNRIVDALARDQRAAVFARARVVHLEQAQFTTGHDTVMQSVDFPVTALLSVTGSVEDGATAEVAGVGTDCFVEIDAALHDTVAKRSAICLLEGDVIRIPLDDFQRGIDTSRDFCSRVYRSVRARAFVTEQIELCNIRHSVQQRLARWIALAQVRCGRADFPVSHEFLASLLGTRRAGISEATAALEAQGAVAHTRAYITIVDRGALANAACECFGICRDAIDEAFT